MQTKYCFKLVSLTDIYFYHVTESETFISAEIIVNHYFLQQTTSALVHHHWTVDHRGLQEKNKVPYHCDKYLMNPLGTPVRNHDQERQPVVPSLNWKTLWIRLLLQTNTDGKTIFRIPHWTHSTTFYRYMSQALPPSLTSHDIKTHALITRRSHKTQSNKFLNKTRDFYLKCLTF